MTIAAVARESDPDAGEVPDRGELAPGASVARRYVVQRLLGKGGMGHVYEVVDRLLGESVALKISSSDAHAALDAIRHEVLMARRITHPNVARIFDIGQTERSLYMTMELVPGKPLNRVMARKPLPIQECVRIGSQLACALGAAHDVHVLHLDIKPGNVMLVPGTPERVVLLDFGISRAFGARGGGLGTMTFASPEQLRNEPLTGASDVYSLGLLLYVMATAERPFSAEPAGARKDEANPPLHIDCSPALAKLVNAMVAPIPADRPTIAEIASELAGLSLEGDQAQCAIAVSSRWAQPDLATLPDAGGERLVRARQRLLVEDGGQDAEQTCDELLQVQPQLEVAVALRALALARRWTAEDSAREGRECADRTAHGVAEALANVPHLADAHCADALVALSSGQVAYSVRALRRALTREPMHAMAHEVLGALELWCHEASDARIRLADAIAPGRSSPMLLLATTATYAGRLEEARGLAGEAEARGTHPRATFLWRARWCSWFDDRQGAALLLQDQRAQQEDHALARMMLEVVARHVSPPQISAMFAPLLQADVPPLRKAMLFRVLAEIFARRAPESALLCLARASTLPSVDLLWFDSCPALAPIRESRGFAAARAHVVERLRLAFVHTDDVSQAARADQNDVDVDATTARVDDEKTALSSRE